MSQIDYQLLKENLREALGNLVFRRVERVTVRNVVETRWYTGPGEYTTINPRKFTEAELNKHVEYINNGGYTFFTSPASVRNDQWKRQAIYGSSFCAATVDPVSLELTKRPTKTLVHKGDLVCGFVKPPTRQGQAPHFTKWFICSEQALRAWTAIMYDDHKTLQDEPKLRNSYLAGNNRLCTNTHLKECIVREQNGLEFSDEDRAKSFYHLRTEAPSSEWVHIYAALVLMVRYEELPTDENVPQSRAPNALRMEKWHLPEDYVNQVASLFT